MGKAGRGLQFIDQQAGTLLEFSLLKKIFF
jgi:hypothetical protein